jgi:hypothetical protein
MGGLFIAVRTHLHPAREAVKALGRWRDEFAIVASGTILENLTAVLLLLYSF